MVVESLVHFDGFRLHYWALYFSPSLDDSLNPLFLLNLGELLLSEFDGRLRLFRAGVLSFLRSLANALRLH